MIVTLAEARTNQCARQFRKTKSSMKTKSPLAGAAAARKVRTAEAMVTVLVTPPRENEFLPPARIRRPAAGLASS
jgi:hypothetical protein